MEAVERDSYAELTYLRGNFAVSVTRIGLYCLPQNVTDIYTISSVRSSDVAANGQDQSYTTL